MDKIKRATEIHRTMTPHQMALRIVEMEYESSAAIEAMNIAREAINEGTAKLAEYDAKLDSYDKRITELQDALELAEEAMRAKQQPEALDGWQLVPVDPTIEMVQAATHSAVGFGTRAVYKAILAAAPKPEGGAA